MKKTLVCLGLATACAISLYAAPKAKALDDTKIGISGDVMKEDVVLPDYKFSEDAPGTSKKFERSFENAPPLIPHSLEGLIPITKDNNMCVTCHMPDVAEAVGATPVPKSHMSDFRDEHQKFLGDNKLAEQRFNCTTCHVPQAKTATLKKNNFDADFRQKDGKNKSNLLDVLNDGASLAE